MSLNKHLLIRKTHRYLGFFIGIQFLGWTVSGLYFSWNNIDDVHGDQFRKAIKYIPANVQLTSPTEAIVNLKHTRPVDSIESIHLIRILDKHAYQIVYFSSHSKEGLHHYVNYALADAATGKLREPLSIEEAIAIAVEQVAQGAAVMDIQYLEKTNSHHEYREKPLPAWAITFTNPDCTIYISSELGTFQAIRHNQWRAFDFLWMLHTMDYKSRDDINNWWLRIFSVVGLITVLSGFILFFISSRTIKKLIA